MKALICPKIQILQSQRFQWRSPRQERGYRRESWLRVLRL